MQTPTLLIFFWSYIHSFVSKAVILSIIFHSFLANNFSWYIFFSPMCLIYTVPTTWSGHDIFLINVIKIIPIQLEYCPPTPWMVILEKKYNWSTDFKTNRYKKIHPLNSPFNPFSSLFSLVVLSFFLYIYFKFINFGNYFMVFIRVEFLFHTWVVILVIGPSSEAVLPVL